MPNEPEQATTSSEQSEEQTAETPKYREISSDELKEILAQHRKWVESGRKEGQGEKALLANCDLSGEELTGVKLVDADLRGASLRAAHLRGAHLHYAQLHGANLSEADLFAAQLTEASLVEAQLQEALLRKAVLEKANLRRARMEGADLREASLKEADLGEANLQGANLAQANFHEAQLLGTKLRDANLQDADLTGATGLLASQFAGANVSGAKLPKDIHEFKGVEQVEKISQRAQKLFLSILLGCVYCWLTIAITTDVGLITNSGSSPLPIIQTKIPIAGFYWAAPLILLSLYFWFHLYLQRLWEDLAELPAVFPDGKALDKKVYPWLISGMVRSHVRLLKDHRPALSRIQSGISVLLAWWVIPFTFLLFWLRYIPRHDWVGTSLHVGVLAVSITAAILLHRLAAKTLRGERTSSLSWKAKVKSLPAYQHASLTLGILGLSGIIFFHLSTWAIEGVRPNNPTSSWEDLSKPPPESTSLGWHDGRILLPRLFDYFGYRTYANLVEADMSTKPPTWTGQKDKLKDEIPLVKGAKLKGANFQNANMIQAFLINADLRGAHLEGANLGGANLQKAVLVRAHLEKANLGGAHLEEANLLEAYLQEADLYGANLEKANLGGAHLEGAKNLTQAQLNQACVDERTKLPEGLTRPKPCSEEDLLKK